jgi:hypothetical protein
MALQRAEQLANAFLLPRGLLCRACCVGHYNAYPTVAGSRLRTIVHPDTLQPLQPTSLMLVLANSGAAWAPFIAWLRLQPAREDTPDAFDSYTAHVVALLLQHMEQAGHAPLFWRQDTQTRPYTVIVQVCDV